MFLAGTGKGDITAFKQGVGMLGYGIYYNTMESVATPLSARCFIFIDKTNAQKICYVNCELGFITVALKKGVLKYLERHHPELNYSEENLMLTAQHTHSGPSGYSYYGLYNLSTPGFVIEIYKKIVDGIVEAILNAEKNISPAALSWSTGLMEPDKEVAYQRSVEAYNRNPEVNPKITFDQRHTAVNREMTFLKVTSPDGNERGSINWYAVHPTNLPNTNHQLCYDNKGFAAAYLEKHFEDKGNSDYLGIFAQGNCGDVTPRVKRHPVYPFQRGQWEGKFADDMESAKYNGQVQFEKAKQISEQNDFKAIEGEIDYALMFVNFAAIQALPKFTNGNTQAVTDAAAMGVAFFEGTKIDGPGLHPAFGFFVKMYARLIKRIELFKTNFSKPEYKKVIDRKYAAQGTKDIMIESNRRRVLGTGKLERIAVPAWADPAIASFKYFYNKVGHINRPWTPQVMPIQLYIIGDVALAAFPFEITTIAGNRLQNSLQETLAARGVTKVILCPYANGYSGYITTNEEYQEQMYEGGHTVFGQWSLAALQTKFEFLATEMLKPKPERKFVHDAIPPDFTEEELNQFPFYKRAWYIRQELIRARKMERKS